MSRVKFYISAVIFILVTAVKLMSPTIAQELKDRLLPAIDENADYRAAMLSLGKKLTDEEGIIAVLNNLNKDKDADDSEPEFENSDGEQNTPAYKPATICELRESFSAVVPEFDEAGDAAAWEEDDKEPAREAMAEIPQDEGTHFEEEAMEQHEEESIPEAVAAFLESQKEYSEYEVPENVSYSMLPLPFEYTSPVRGYTSSGFGYRLHPIIGTVKFHYGTDFCRQCRRRHTCLCRRHGDCRRGERHLRPLHYYRTRRRIPDPLRTLQQGIGYLRRKREKGAENRLCGADGRDHRPSPPF